MTTRHSESGSFSLRRFTGTQLDSNLLTDIMSQDGQLIILDFFRTDHEFRIPRPACKIKLVLTPSKPLQFLQDLAGVWCSFQSLRAPGRCTQGICCCSNNCKHFLVSTSPWWLAISIDSNWMLFVFCRQVVPISTWLPSPHGRWLYQYHEETSSTSQGSIFSAPANNTR